MAILNKRSKKVFEKATLQGINLWTVKENREINDMIIYFPVLLHKKTMEWYHVNLQHPGETKTFLTMKAHFSCQGMTKQVS